MNKIEQAHYCQTILLLVNVYNINLMSELSYRLSISIPFENDKQASMARKTMAVDPVLKSNELLIKFNQEENKLICQFMGTSDRVIRVAISNVIDNVKTIIECFDEFDGKDDVQFEEKQETI